MRLIMKEVLIIYNIINLIWGHGIAHAGGGS